MPAHIQDLGRQVLRRPAERVRLIARLQELGQTEVSQRDVAIVVHEYILRFEVTMHDVARVQVAQSQHNLRTDELNCSLLEATDLVNVIIDITSRQVLKEEVDFEFVLEDEVHRVYKWVICLEQNVLLILDVLYLLLLQ